jgi:hypothetical protein
MIVCQIDSGILRRRLDKIIGFGFAAVYDRMFTNLVNISTCHKGIGRMNILLFGTLENKHLHSRCKSKV